jgi:hypothetical protein
MSEQQTLEQVAPGGVIQLTNPPAALDENSFDDLFPANGQKPATPAAQPQQAQPVQQTQTPAAQQQDQFFLKGDNSVYKTQEEAVKGLNIKDQQLNELRQRYALITGIDPLTGKPVAPNEAPQAEMDYFQNPNQYLEDLYKAAQKGGPEAYRDVQAKFIYDSVKPLQPILQKAARDQAVQSLTTELPGAANFVGTPAYNQALEGNPELKQAISVGETDHRFHSRLPGLYKLAYLTSQGMQVPELLKAQAKTQTPQQQQVTQPVRTTVVPTTPAAARPTTPPSFKTIDGIKAIIADAEGRGARLDF